MNVEFLCARESVRLLRRDPKKYYTLISALHLGSLINFKTARLIRTAYLFVRHVDDILDGDSRLDGHAPDYVDSIRHQIESVKGSRVVRSWFTHELSRSKEELLRLRQELKEASETIPYMLCNGV